MSNEVIPSDYRETLEIIIRKIEEAQLNAILSSNLYMMNLYWLLGNDPNMYPHAMRVRTEEAMPIRRKSND
jgi:hypothetical protein